MSSGISQMLNRRMPLRSMLVRLPQSADAGISVQSVIDFLSANPFILDEYIAEHVSVDRIQIWLNRKTIAAAETAPVDDKGKESEKKKQKLATQHLCERFQNLNLLKIQEQLHKDFFSTENFTLMLYDVANVLGTATSSDDYSLYIVEPGGNEISLYQPDLISDRQKLTEPVDDSTTVSAFAAFSKAPVFIEDMHADERFPQGAGLHREDTYSVLSFPLVLQNGDLLAVIELIRNAGSSSFTKREMQLGICFMGIAGLAIEKSQQCNALTKQQELNDFLLHASHLVVEGSASVDALISHIMSFTKRLVSAERCTFFLLDKQTEELYCSLFDEGDRDADGKDVFCKKPEVRFSIKHGIAGHVARTREILNIKNAYEDPRFNRGFDKESGFTTRCILCMPILSGDSVLGVVQMINKTDGGIFTNADEQTFKVFAVYCSLAIHYSNLATSSADLKNRYQVQLEKLVYHTKCSEEEYDKLLTRPLLKRLPHGFTWYEFYVNKHVADIPQLFIHMVHHLFGTEIFSQPKLCRFILTLRNAYRQLPYHDFKHAFTVFHCMYKFLSDNPDAFSQKERMALFFACTCHDLDHRGLSNSFHQKTQTALGRLYPECTNEYHHFNEAIAIFKYYDCDVFDFLQGSEYTEMMRNIQYNIISTDVCLYARRQQKLDQLMLSNIFTMENEEHRDLVKAVLLCVCDLSGCAKPWDVAYEFTMLLYEEFYIQGDIEKAMGLTPMPSLDRDKKDGLPADQINFLTTTFLPSLITLRDIFPNAQTLVDLCMQNIQQWKSIEAGKPPSMWVVADSVPAQEDIEIEAPPDLSFI